MPDSARFEALLAIKRSISAVNTDPEHVLRTVVQQALAIIPRADGAIVQMRDAGNLVYRAASGAAQRLLGRRIGIADSFAGRSITSGVPLICADIQRETRIDPAPYREAEMRALMAVPLIRRGRSIGALKFYARRPSAFAASDLLAAELVGDHLVSGLGDITEGVDARAPHEDAEGFEALVETMPHRIWMMTADGRTTYANAAMTAALGVDRSRILGSSPLSFIAPSSRRPMLEHWLRARGERRPVEFECRAEILGGVPQWLLVHLSPLPFDGGEPTAWVGSATDISDRKAQEFDLRAEARTRELLLDEANHRMKNSLQIVTGLLALHASRVDHDEARARMMEARSQISTIARMHQAISSASHDDQIELVGFLRDLAGSLIGNGAQRRADLRFSAPDTLFLPVEQGVPVALVTGEIITNAVKYATCQPEAAISVDISTDDARHAIQIADNGPGLPPDLDLDRSPGLGMEIIFGLARQAGGFVEIDRAASGACLRLVLPIAS